MKKSIIFSLLLLLSLSNLVLSVELPSSKAENWYLQFNYAKLYNYRYARSTTNSNLSPQYIAYLDTGNIACYTNSIGALVQRKLWSFIFLQTGINFSRRGYLDSYILHNNPPYKTIQRIPWKVISIPLAINFIQKFKNSFQIGVGLGFEEGWYFNSRFSEPKMNLKQHSRGFFGFRWNKNRIIDQNTLVDIEYRGSFSSLQWTLQTHIGIQTFRNFFVLFGLNYYSVFKYNSISRDQGNPSLNLNLNYEVKSYILSSSVALSYSF